MSPSEQHAILHAIASDFEILASRIDGVLEAFAEHESGSVDVAALRRAKDAAQCGARIARNATSEVRRAFD